MQKRQRNEIQNALLTAQAEPKIDMILRGLTAIEIEVLKSKIIKPEDMRPVINLGRGIKPEDQQ